MKQLLTTLALLFALSAGAQLSLKKSSISAIFYVRSLSELQGLRAEEGDLAKLDSVITEYWMCTKTYKFMLLRDGQIGWKLLRTDFNERNRPQRPRRLPYVRSAR